MIFEENEKIKNKTNNVEFIFEYQIIEMNRKLINKVNLKTYDARLIGGNKCL